jgi:hypothetical protein
MIKAMKLLKRLQRAKRRIQMTDEKISNETLKELQNLNPEKEIAIFKFSENIALEEIQEVEKMLINRFPDLRFILLSNEWEIETLSVENLIEKLSDK